jgi:cell division protein FtsB
MASHSLPLPLSSVRKPVRRRVAARPQSLWIVVAVFIALLILFTWLRMILALEIASTGRDIQARNADLQRIVRRNNERQRLIAEQASPENLAQSALDLGFLAHQPIYVPLSQPFVTSPGDQGMADAGLPGAAKQQQLATLEGQSLLELVGKEIESLLEVEVAP